jgi:glycosyltransferase involved in cell wall biosynthesis
MEKVIIGIPVHNDLESLKATIQSIIESTEFPHEIVIVESGSTDGADEYCDYLELTKKNVRVYHTPKEGPLKAYNFLFQLAGNEGHDLLLSQTDVIYPKLYKRDWLRAMWEASKIPECGAVIPVNGGGISGPDYIDKYRWIGGWCTYLPLKTVEKTRFDENFPSGYGVDIDLTYQITNKLNKRIYTLPFWVDHHMMNERIHDKNENTELMKKKSAEYFRKKWKLNA